MRVEKPWGYEIRWAVNDKYIGKLLRIEVAKAFRQYHQQKDETIYVLEGKLVLELGPQGYRQAGKAYSTRRSLSKNTAGHYTSLCCTFWWLYFD